MYLPDTEQTGRAHDVHRRVPHIDPHGRAGRYRAATVGTVKRAVALAAVALLVACGGRPPLKSGVVIGHEHKGAYDSTMMICSSYTSKGACIVWVPIITHHNEAWRVHLRETPGKYTSWRTVTEEKYGTCPVGSVCTINEGDHP